MTLSAVIAALGFLFGSGIVLGMVRLAMAVGGWRQEVTELRQDMAQLQADREKDQAARDGAAALKSAAHEAIHKRIETVDHRTGKVAMAVVRLQTHCEGIHGPISQVTHVDDVLTPWKENT